ncbi:hypothetical protein T484DRAFT_1810301 [Baffinella frigidus]|nr:hypothetical protein T484DRAFT_1810301 [Cryptophyta sp. CCMP2293]
MPTTANMMIKGQSERADQKMCLAEEELSEMREKLQALGESEMASYGRLDELKHGWTNGFPKENVKQRLREVLEGFHGGQGPNGGAWMVSDHTPVLMSKALELFIKEIAIKGSFYTLALELFIKERAIKGSFYTLAAAPPGSKDVTLDEKDIFAAIVHDPALALLHQDLRSLGDARFSGLTPTTPRSKRSISEALAPTPPFPDPRATCLHGPASGPAFGTGPPRDGVWEGPASGTSGASGASGTTTFQKSSFVGGESVPALVIASGPPRDAMCDGPASGTACGTGPPRGRGWDGSASGGEGAGGRGFGRPPRYLGACQAQPPANT